MQTRYIIAAALASVVCTLAMAVVTRFLVHKHAKSTDSDAESNTKQQAQLKSISRSWKQLFATKQPNNKSHWVPSLGAIIGAGNEGVWSSTLFTQYSQPGELSFGQLCDTFAAPPVNITRSLSTKPISAPKRVQSMSHKGARREEVKLQRKSLDIRAGEIGLARRLSVKKAAPALVPMSNGLEGGKQGAWKKSGSAAQYHNDKLRVKVSSAELAALAVVLGAEVTTGDAAPYKGAYGISVSLTPTEDGKYQLVLRQHKRKVSQMPTTGSGVSPLFAMHMASGSLPFSQDGKALNSILITNETFEVVQTGTSLSWNKSSQQTSQSKFLNALPSSTKLNFHTFSASSRPSTTLIDAIAALPFSGGLPPLAHAPLIKTISFIASGGLTPARLLQRLEGFVDKVQLHAPHLSIFGPLHTPQNAALLFRERERLGKLASYPATSDSPADKASRMQRYTTLLERLMALIPDSNAQEVRAAVQAATARVLSQSYADAVAAHAAPTPQGIRTPASTISTRQSLETSSSRRVSATFTAPNLGSLAEGLLKTSLPLDIEDVAVVARLVIAAWCCSVDVVGWEGVGVKVWAGEDKGEVVF